MIFVDTSFFFALFAANDPDHKRVLEVFASFKGRPLPELLLTTNHLVFETIRLARRRSGHEAAVFAGTRLMTRSWPASIGRVPKRSEPPSHTSPSTRTSTTARWTV